MGWFAALRGKGCRPVASWLAGHLLQGAGDGSPDVSKGTKSATRRNGKRTYEFLTNRTSAERPQRRLERTVGVCGLSG